MTQTNAQVPYDSFIIPPNTYTDIMSKPEVSFVWKIFQLIHEKNQSKCTLGKASQAYFWWDIKYEKPLKTRSCEHVC